PYLRSIRGLPGGGLSLRQDRPETDDPDLGGRRDDLLRTLYGAADRKRTDAGAGSTARFRHLYDVLADGTVPVGALSNRGAWRRPRLLLCGRPGDRGAVSHFGRLPQCSIGARVRDPALCIAGLWSHVARPDNVAGDTWAVARDDRRGKRRRISARASGQDPERLRMNKDAAMQRGPRGAQVSRLVARGAVR